MKQVEYDPKWAVCIECDGQGKFEDGQGQWWLCRSCAGYGSPAARIYGEKHPDQIKPASIQRVDQQGDWTDQYQCASTEHTEQRDYSKSRSNLATPVVYRVEWSDIAASLWGDILYSSEADRGFR
jgi:hypothetical protein